MAINKSSYKITETEIAQNQLQGKTNPLKGNVSENQAMFDKLPKKVAQKFNDFVDAATEEINKVDKSCDDHKKDTENPHLTTAHQVGSYSKEETDFKLEKLETEVNNTVEGAEDRINAKCVELESAVNNTIKSAESRVDTKVIELEADVDNKLDEFENKTNEQLSEQNKTFESALKTISTVYKFKGSVENIKDVLITYCLVPGGNPTVNGKVVGTYNSEGYCIEQNTVVPDGVPIKLPIEPITLNPGIYQVGSLFIEVNGVDWMSPLNVTEPTTITEVHLSNSFTLSMYTEKTLISREMVLGYLYVGENTDYNITEIGDVYNETSTGMNYAWKGTEWDPLGGKHEDLEARADIELLNRNKVDKEEGKGLSANDFTNEYKSKLNSLDETIDLKVDALQEDVDNLSDELEAYKEDVTVTLNQKADKTDTYTKTETDTKLDKKADKSSVYTKSEVYTELNKKVNKSDITNVYKFKGSIDTVAELPFKWEFIPNGVPTIDGEPCGTYDEETNTVTVDEDYRDCEVIFPIKPIILKETSSYYFCDNLTPGIGYVGDYLFHIYDCAGGFGESYQTLTKGTVIDKVIVIECCSSSTNNLGTLYKGYKTWYDGYDWDDDGILDEEYPYIPYDALTNGEVYNVIENGMNYAWTGTGWDALGGEHKDLEAREEIKRLKESTVSAYRFCGSVENFEDLPIEYHLIPNGVPMLAEYDLVSNTLIVSEPCGSYDEKTHTVTVDVDYLGDKCIRIPIVPITLKPGKYYPDYGAYYPMYIGSIASYPHYILQQIDKDEVVTYIEMFHPGTDGGEFRFSISSLGSIPRVIDSFLNIDEYDNVEYVAPDGAYSPGAVYEVKESGLSYGWTGSSWDALGTSHIDQEARDGIENLETQIGDIETALDSIIEIQNSLIGGESV